MGSHYAKPRLPLQAMGRAGDLEIRSKFTVPGALAFHFTWRVYCHPYTE